MQYLRKKKWGELEPEQARFLVEQAEIYCLRRAFLQLTFISLIRDQVIQGYSPQAKFHSFPSPDERGRFHFNTLDWRMTLRSLTKFPILSFFKTPDLEVEIVGKQIHIHIFNPENVKADTMRQINKIYTLFLKRLKLGRAGWGVKRRSRKYYEERDKFLIEQDIILKQHFKSWDKRSEKLKELLGEKFHRVSTETMRKIIGKGRKRMQ